MNRLQSSPYQSYRIVDAETLQAALPKLKRSFKLIDLSHLCPSCLLQRVFCCPTCGFERDTNSRKSHSLEDASHPDTEMFILPYQFPFIFKLHSEQLRVLQIRFRELSLKAESPSSKLHRKQADGVFSPTQEVDWLEARIQKLNTTKRIQVVKSLVPWRIVESNLHKYKGLYQGTAQLQISLFNVLTGCREHSLSSHLELLRIQETSFCSRLLLPSDPACLDAPSSSTNSLTNQSELRLHSSCSLIEVTFSYKKLLKTQRFLLCAQNFLRAKRSDTYYCYLVMKNKLTIKLYFLPVFARQEGPSREHSPQKRSDEKEPHSPQQRAQLQAQASASLSDSSKSTPRAPVIAYFVACALQVRIGPEIKDSSSVSKGGFVSSMKKARLSENTQNIRLNVARPAGFATHLISPQSVEQSGDNSCLQTTASVSGKPPLHPVQTAQPPVFLETANCEPTAAARVSFNFSKKQLPNVQQTSSKPQTHPEGPGGCQAPHSQRLVSTEARLDLVQRDGRIQSHHFLLKASTALPAISSGSGGQLRTSTHSTQRALTYIEVRVWSVASYSALPEGPTGFPKLVEPSSQVLALTASPRLASVESDNRPKPQIYASPEHATQRFK